VPEPSWPTRPSVLLGAAGDWEGMSGLVWVVGWSVYRGVFTGLFIWHASELRAGSCVPWCQDGSQSVALCDHAARAGLSELIHRRHLSHRGVEGEPIFLFMVYKELEESEDTGKKGQGHEYSEIF
jgi:hypothetical protein